MVSDSPSTKTMTRNGDGGDGHANAHASGGGGCCGCLGGDGPKVPPQEQAPWKREQSGKESGTKKEVTFGRRGSVENKRKDSVARMSQGTQNAARMLFSEYRLRMSQGEVPESEKLGANMTQGGLRRPLGDSVNEELFQFLWHLFDTKGNGTVNGDEFVMTMALITGDECHTIEQQVEAVFVMFDVDDAGALSETEFHSLIQAKQSMAWHA